MKVYGMFIPDYVILIVILRNFLEDKSFRPSENLYVTNYIDNSYT